MDRFEAMSILVATVETGSFSAAGRKLGVALATVSRKVADLEMHLNTRLLVRSTRALILTEAGAASRRFLEFAVPRLRKALEKLTKRNPPGLAKMGSNTGAYA